MNKGILGLDYLRQKARKNGMLLSLHLDVTYRCPQRCIHCYIDERERGEMSLSEIERILRDARRLNALFATFSGGEVFARRDFDKILEIANGLGLSIKLITSGYLIGKREVDLLKKNRVINVGISLYSLRPDVHDAITGIEGSCKRTIRAIKLIKSAGLHIVVKSIIMRHNYQYYPELLRWLHSLGENVTPQYDVVVSPTMGYRSGVREMNLSLEEKRAMILELRKIEKRRMLRYEDMESGLKKGPDKDAITCYAGITGLYIDPEGKVFPCVEWQRLIGDLKKDSLLSIWKNSEVLKEIQALRIYDYKKCKDCKYVYGCSICPGLNLRDTGSIFTPSTLVCERAKAYYEGK